MLRRRANGTKEDRLAELVEEKKVSGRSVPYKYVFKMVQAVSYYTVACIPRTDEGHLAPKRDERFCHHTGVVQYYTSKSSPRIRPTVVQYSTEQNTNVLTRPWQSSTTTVA